MSETIEILITIPLEEEHVEALKAVSERVNITLHPARQGSEIPPELWEKTEVLYTMQALPEPDQAPFLRWIQFYLAGVDASIDAPVIQQDGLMLTTMSGANATTVAEHAVTMLLALGHRLPEFMAYQNRAEWMSDKSTRYLPSELRGSTVGIVGYGSVGRQIARLLQPFGVQVLATKQDVMHPEDSGYTPEGSGDPEGDLFTRLYPPQAIRSMFRGSDFIVVAVPLTQNTTGIIGKEQLAELKPNAILVDVSRGGVIDQEALIEALTNNRLAGAALDVFPEEPLPADNPLWQMPNVILTPHIAGFSPHYNRRANTLFIENLIRFIKKDPLLNLVNQEKGY